MLASSTLVDARVCVVRLVRTEDVDEVVEKAETLEAGIVVQNSLLFE